MVLYFNPSLDANGQVSFDSVLVQSNLLPNYVSGNWYQPYGTFVAASGTIATGSIRMIPFTVPTPVRISDIGFFVTTGAASGLARGAIYRNNNTTGRPTGNALADTGNFSTTNTGLISASVTPVTLSPGIYWSAIQTDATAGAAVQMQNVNVGLAVAAALSGSPTASDITNSATNTSLIASVAQAFGTFPDMTSATITVAPGSGSALVKFKVA